MKRLTAYFLAALMLSGGLIALVGPMSETAEASNSIICPAMAIDGGITYYTATTQFAVNPSSTDSMVYAKLDGKWIQRTYLSFDTSNIPSNVAISSAILYFRAGNMITPQSTSVYSTSLGESLDASDWDSGALHGSFVAEFIPKVGWNSVPLAISSVSGSEAQFEVKISNEEGPLGSFNILMEETSNYKPYIVVNYKSFGSLNFYSDSGVYTTNVIPSVEPLNQTHDCYVYEFDTWPQLNYVTISKGTESWRALGVTPKCDSLNDTGSFITITGIIENVSYRVYVAVPRSQMVDVHVSTYISSTGEGVPFESFHMRYSPGLSYSDTDALDIVSSNFRVSYGGQYTVAVLDYFGNVIATQSFIADVDLRYVTISLDVHSFKVFNQQDSFSKFSIMYEGASTPLEFYVAPNEPVERFLRSGDYTVDVTRYDNTTAFSVERYEVTVSSAQFLIIEGMTLSLIISDVNGLYDRQDLIAQNITIIHNELANMTMYSNVYVSMFISATGEGVPFESFRMGICDGAIFDPDSVEMLVSPNFQALKGGQFTIAALDYFGNVLATQTFVAEGRQVYIMLPIDVHSFKVFNQKEDFTKFSIYYNGTGAALSFFCAPNEPVERFLRSGDYTVVVTYYTNGVAGASEFFQLTVSDAEFLMIKGNTISRVISDIQGVNALQEVITELVTPDMVFIKENMPSVPTGPVEYVHPWSVVTATTRQNASGTDMAFSVPHPGTAGTTYTILDDRLYFAGAYDTEVWVNTTDGVVYHGTTLPASIALNGQAVTVETSSPVSCERVSKWRGEDLFWYAYYTAQRRYEVTLNVNNTLGWGALENVDWFIGFPENRSIDTSSVRIQDLDNAVYLVSGLNYDITQSGMRMVFDTLTPDMVRSFKFTMYDANATSGQGTAQAAIDSYTATRYQGEPYYIGTCSWTNSFTYAYSGTVTIALTFDKARYIDPSSIVVIDRMKNRQLLPGEFTYTGSSIIISNVENVPISGVYGFEVYFWIDYGQVEKLDLTAPLAGVGISPLIIMLIGAVGLVGAFVGSYVYHGKHTAKIGYLLLTYGSIVAIMLILSMQGMI